MRLQLNNPSFLDPTFEFVTLLPERFLPFPVSLGRYDFATGSRTSYIPSPDRRLRKLPGHDTCPPFPPFSGPSREPGARLNPFLVVLNADIVMRQYRHRGIQRPPEQAPLPEDVEKLIKKTREVVELIYWTPIIKTGLATEQVQINRDCFRRMNSARPARPKPGVMKENSVELDMSSDGGDASSMSSDGPGHDGAMGVPWDDEADLGTLMAPILGTSPLYFAGFCLSCTNKPLLFRFAGG